MSIVAVYTQWIFIVLNVSQGFIIFIFFGILNTYEEWKNLIIHKRKRTLKGGTKSTQLSKYRSKERDSNGEKQSEDKGSQDNCSEEKCLAGEKHECSCWKKDLEDMCSAAKKRFEDQHQVNYDIEEYEMEPQTFSGFGLNIMPMSNSPRTNLPRINPRRSDFGMDDNEIFII